MKKQSLIKGTLILGVASIFARFLGLFFRIPLQGLIGDEGMGYYQMSYPLYMMFVAVASGIPIAVSKIISEMNAKKDTGGIIYVLRLTLIIMIPIGGIFSMMLLLFSKEIIFVLKWNIKSYYAFTAVAIAPIFVVILGTFRGFFQGLQDMRPTAVSQIIEQIGRVSFGVGLAVMLFPKGIEYAAGGAALGTVIGAIFGTLYLIIKYARIRREIIFGKYKNKANVMKKIIRVAVPISFGAAVGTVMGLMDSILVPQGLLKAGFNSRNAAIVYGQLTGKAATLANVPMALSIALCSSIVPIISEAFVMNRRLELSKKVEIAIKLSCVISIPSALGLFFMAHPIMNLVFQGDVGGFKILKVLSIAIPFIVLCQSSTALLQAMNKFFEPVLNLLIGCIIKVILTYILVPIPKINIYGAVIGTIIGYVIVCILNMNLLRKNLKMPINYYEVTVKPGYAATIMIFSVVFTYNYVYNNTVNNTISTMISIVVGITVYAFFIVIFGVFKYSDIMRKVSGKFKH